MSDIHGFIAAAADRVNSTLDELLPSESIEPQKLHSAVRWSVFGGGKRIRPVLVMLTGACFGVEEDRLLATAAAIEMIHTYSLIHDDLPAMDNDDLRRGRETCHVKYGEATAILAGDLLETLAFVTIAQDRNVLAEQRVRLISEIGKAAASPSGMVAGQQFDLDAEGVMPDAELLNKIHTNKTGSLIRASVRAGAIIAKASGSDIEALSEFGIQLGLLFQITDDLLDVTQSSLVLGKTAAKDLVSEKATYPRLYGVDGTRDLAAAVHAKALGALGNVSVPTLQLRQISDMVLNRDS
jgi:geranylgeranyl pyrophosphate synthase